MLIIEIAKCSQELAFQRELAHPHTQFTVPTNILAKQRDPLANNVSKDLQGMLLLWQQAEILYEPTYDHGNTNGTISSEVDQMEQMIV